MSVPLNISEGMYSRGKNRSARLSNAMASAKESVACLEVAVAVDYLDRQSIARSARTARPSGGSPVEHGPQTLAIALAPQGSHPMMRNTIQAAAARTPAAAGSVRSHLMGRDNLAQRTRARS